MVSKDNDNIFGNHLILQRVKLVAYISAHRNWKEVRTQE